MLRGPLQRVLADRTWNPNRRVRLLVRSRPRVDVSILVVLAFPSEGPRGCPCLHDEIVCFLIALPVVRRRRVVCDAFATGSTHPAGYQSTAGDRIDDRQLLGKPQRVVPDGQDVTDYDDLHTFRDAGEDRRGCVRDALHAERCAVVLVERQTVEAHFFGIQFLIVVSVVEIGR